MLLPTCGSSTGETGPGEQDACKAVPPWLLVGRAGGLHPFHCSDMPQHKGLEKSPSLGKQLIRLLLEQHFKGNLWGRASDSLLIVITVMASAATTMDCIHHSALKSF